MAGSATLNIELEVSGLGETLTMGGDDETLTVPVETAHGYTVVATAQTTALQLSDLAPQIALTKMYGLWIRSKSGTIYVQLDTAGTTTFAEAAAHVVIPVNTGNYISINPAGNLGVCIDAAAVTDAFEWLLLGKA